MTPLAKLISTAAICACLSGCAAPGVSVRMLEPGSSNEAARLRTVAVLPFGGLDGGDFSAEVEALLGGIRLNGQQYFQIVSRRDLDQVLDEFKLSSSGMLGPDTLRAGALMGAQGIYTGQVTNHGVTDSRYFEEKEECSTKNPKGKCTSWVKVHIPCIRRTASFDLALRLVETQSSRVVFSELYREQIEDKACRDDLNPIANSSSLTRKMKDNILEKIRRDVAPYYRTETVKLIDDTEGLPPPQEKTFESALEFASSDRLDRACSLWKQIEDQKTETVPLLHNLAVCSEAQGDMERALHLINRADSLLSKPDKRVGEALARIRGGVSKQAKARQQMP